MKKTIVLLIVSVALLFSMSAVFADYPDEETLPVNGALLVNGGTGVNLRIVAPSGLESVYVKMYKTSDPDEYAASVFIRAGNSATVKVAPGNYNIKVGYGAKWYGTDDLFGPNADYVRLTMDGSSEVFSLSSGTYELKLLASTTGNVGSNSTDLEDF